MGAWGYSRRIEMTSIGAELVFDIMPKLSFTSGWLSCPFMSIATVLSLILVNFNMISLRVTTLLGWWADWSWRFTKLNIVFLLSPE